MGSRPTITFPLVGKTRGCEGCAAALPEEARFCPRCGQATLPTDMINDRSVEFGRSRRRPSLWVLAAVVVGLLVAVMLMSRSNDQDAASATTTAAVATTKAVAPVSTATAATTGATTTVVTNTTTTLGAGGFSTEPPFEQATGLIVYLTTSEPAGDSLVVMDVDQGQRRDVDIAAGSLPPFGSTAALGDTMVFATWAGFTAVGADGQFVEHVGQNSLRYLDVFADVPEGFLVLVGDGIGGVIVLGPDREAYRVVPGGLLTHLDMPLPIALSHGRAVTVYCDADLVCGVTIFDLATGDHHVVPGLTQRGNLLSLSPDGRYLAQINIGRGAFTFAVYDTTTGATVLDGPDPVDPNSRPQWSPDSQWLVWTDSDGVEAWNPTSGTHTLTIDTNQGTVVAAVTTTTPRPPAP